MSMADLTMNLDTSSLEALVNAAANGGLEAIRPAMVTIDAPYAASLEFGTMPAKNKGPTSVHRFTRSDGTVFFEEVSESFWNIYLWATRHATKIDPYVMAKKVHTKLMSEGMAPHPFIRPAIHDVEERFNELLAESGSILGVAEELAEQIRRNIEGAAPDGPRTDTGALIASISTSYDDGADAPDRPDSTIWQSDDSDFQGGRRTKA